MTIRGSHKVLLPLAGELETDNGMHQHGSIVLTKTAARIVFLPESDP
jgi:hypothetical protein